MGIPITQAIYVATELGIPNLLAEGPKDCTALAQSLGVNESALRRLLRLLVSVGIVSAVEGNGFGLTVTGKYLQAGIPGSVRDLAVLGGQPWHLQPWTELRHSITTGEPAFDKLHGMGFFEYLSDHAEAAALFDSAMEAVVGRFADAAAASYDFSAASVIADVGGGNGKLLASILQRYGAARGLLFDLAAVVEGAPRQLEALGVSDRCTCVAGDFFKQVPTGADVYMLSHVLHNWNDERAAAILRACRAAMTMEAKLLVFENVAGPQPDFYTAWLDLEMLVNFGGRERTEAEYRALLEQSGFRLAGVEPVQTSVSAMEGVPV